MFVCPACGTHLGLTLAQHGVGRAVNAEGTLPPSDWSEQTIKVTIAGESYHVSRRGVTNAARRLAPGPIFVYSVCLRGSLDHGVWLPIKQVVREALRANGYDVLSERFRRGFTAHRARDILRRLGFYVREERG